MFSVSYGFVLFEKTIEVQGNLENDYREKKHSLQEILGIRFWNMKKEKFKSLKFK